MKSSSVARVFSPIVKIILIRTRLYFQVHMTKAPFGVPPMVSLVTLPMVPFVANGTIGLPLAPIVPLGDWHYH